VLRRTTYDKLDYMGRDREPAALPSHVRLAWPTLQVMKRLNRPATNKEVVSLVAQELQLTPEQINLRSGSKTRTLLEYRLCWSRTFLKGMGAIAKTGQGEWAVTSTGHKIKEDEIRALNNQVLDSLRANLASNQ
jgi:restriction endonuclease Mrr